MFVCLCNGYRESEIREEARSGLRCVQTLYECLGNGPICRQCVEMAQEIIDEVHGAMDGARQQADEPPGSVLGRSAL